ncbi:hypothetical protein KUTeg_014447 [Tegillarca granosa]|uniref:BAAT/Acyl-CoA thioester hydrolase C-terminal domain-containing protein n=1 Tax=Tegillarca granosa TaxID=220873 RepID=A0ABQ9EWQ2_TEGGR|nr:hypothetical protein KUTeg_014447 [Tegillarca granosa]
MASKGFVVLALAYFAYDDLKPDIISEFSLDYFKEAVEWLCAQRYVNENCIAVNSVCKGAEMGMALTAHCSKIKALIAINGVPFVIYNPMKNGDGYIPCPEYNGYNMEKLHFSKEGMIMKEAFWGEPKDMFKIWKTNTKVLYIVGADDQCIPPGLGQTVYDLYPDDKKSNIELVIYPGAGHLIEPPYAPLCRASYMSSFELPICLHLVSYNTEPPYAPLCRASYMSSFELPICLHLVSYNTEPPYAPLCRASYMSSFELPICLHLVSYNTEPPYAPLCRASYMSSFGMALVWGGKPKEHAYAQKDSWDRIINFLKTTLIDNKNNKCKSSL